MNKTCLDTAHIHKTENRPVPGPVRLKVSLLFNLKKIRQQTLRLCKSHVKMCTVFKN